jgi:hypothetical protein
MRRAPLNPLKLEWHEPSVIVVTVLPGHSGRCSTLIQDIKPARG